jgi:hypothetical protein
LSLSLFSFVRPLEKSGAQVFISFNLAVTYLRYFEETQEVGHLDGSDAGGGADHARNHFAHLRLVAVKLSVVDVAYGS